MSDATQSRRAKLFLHGCEGHSAYDEQKHGQIEISQMQTKITERTD